MDQRFQPIRQPIAAVDEQREVILQREGRIDLPRNLDPGAIRRGVQSLDADLRLACAGIEARNQLLQLHAISPRLARAYFRTALRLCLVRGVSPSLLLHPTDVLGAAEAPGMEFFPGMAAPGARKVAWLGWVLSALREHFDVVGTGEYVRRTAVRRTRPVTRLDAGR